MMNPLISICIPSYNRPVELLRLLDSIDCNFLDIEIVIREDFSPSRLKIRAVLKKFTKKSAYTLRYSENTRNLGYDGNLRALIKSSRGKYVLFMGDDDLFIPNKLNEFISFLKKNKEFPYILRSYISLHEGGDLENFFYLPKISVMPKGEKTVAWLFKRSVSLCGFTISRAEAQKYATSDLDGTLLYQVYLMSMVCLRNKSIYCDIPVAQAIQTFRNDYAMFGNAEAEKIRFTPGIVTDNNSINFTKAYFEVSSYIDKFNNTNLTKLINIELSKYSYPFLSIQRKRGIIPFLRYSKRLENELNFDCTYYFLIYKWSLALFGEKVCDKVIIIIKRFFGYTPNF